MWLTGQLSVIYYEISSTLPLTPAWEETEVKDSNENITSIVDKFSKFTKLFILNALWILYHKCSINFYSRHIFQIEIIPYLTQLHYNSITIQFNLSFIIIMYLTQFFMNFEIEITILKLYYWKLELSLTQLSIEKSHMVLMDCW